MSIEQDQALRDYESKIKDMDSVSLETQWQSCANMIGQSIQASWKSENSEREQEFRDMAELYQKKQEIVQKYITLRAK